MEPVDASPQPFACKGVMMNHTHQPMYTPIVRQPSRDATRVRMRQLLQGMPAHAPGTLARQMGSKLAQRSACSTHSGHPPVTWCTREQQECTSPCFN